MSAARVPPEQLTLDCLFRRGDRLAQWQSKEDRDICLVIHRHEKLPKSRLHYSRQN